MTEYTVRQLILNHEKAFQPEKAAGVEAVIQYHLTGEEGGDRKEGSRGIPGQARVHA